MSIRRREFLKSLTAAGAASLVGATSAGALSVRAAETVGLHRSDALPGAPLRILILGGTGFIGPYQVRYAVERGHQVTVFNRGRRQADLPANVEHLTGDRNDDLKSLEGRDWDVVIDNPTTLPAWVRGSASLLQGHANQYVFISTISVYADNSQPGMDETGPLAPYRGADPLSETMETFLRQNPGELYGPLKARAEREAETWFPDRTTVIRPGLIVGPGDPSDRFTYWPVRVSRGGEVLAPGTPRDPVQVIDARDLSEWTIRMVEQNVTGIYNATGHPLEFGPVLESMRPLAEAPVSLTFADADFLAAQEVQAWSDMPVWVPPSGDTAGFARLSIARALARGLTFRPIGQTAAETLAWFRTLPAERQGELLAGLSPDREAEVLRAWHARVNG